MELTEERMKVREALDWLAEEMERQGCRDMVGKITTMVHDCPVIALKSGHVMWEGNMEKSLEIDEWLMRQRMHKMQYEIKDGVMEYHLEVI